MALTLYTFTQLVSNVATAVQASAAAALDFAAGSVLRAVAEATAGVALWLQAVVLQVLTLTRAATSAGTDLDSWCADYGFLRLPAAPAAGQVTFSRFTPAQQAVVPVGTGVQTADGTQAFAVTLDLTNAAYNAALGGYVLPAGTASVNVPVQAATPGSGGNVRAGTVAAVTSPVAGVDTVTNAAAFTSGADAEPDGAFRARFVLYLASLSKATKVAVGAAVLGVQQGLSYTITENQDPNGTYDPGIFLVVVDDGTGHASADLINRVSVAVEAVRGLSTRYGVFAPQTVVANVVLVVTSAPGLSHATVVGNVGVAVTNFLTGLTLGTGLPYTQLAAVAYAVPGVTNVSGVLLNGGTADLSATPLQRVVPGTVTVS